MTARFLSKTTIVVTLIFIYIIMITAETFADRSTSVLAAHVEPQATAKMVKFFRRSPKGKKSKKHKKSKSKKHKKSKSKKGKSKETTASTSTTTTNTPTNRPVAIVKPKPTPTPTSTLRSDISGDDRSDNPVVHFPSRTDAVPTPDSLANPRNHESKYDEGAGKSIPDDEATRDSVENPRDIIPDPFNTTGEEGDKLPLIGILCGVGAFFAISSVVGTIVIRRRAISKRKDMIDGPATRIDTSSVTTKIEAMSSAEQLNYFKGQTRAIPPMRIQVPSMMEQQSPISRDFMSPRPASQCLSSTNLLSPIASSPVPLFNQNSRLLCPSPVSSAMEYYMNESPPEDRRPSSVFLFGATSSPSTSLPQKKRPARRPSSVFLFGATSSPSTSLPQKNRPASWLPPVSWE